MINPAFISFDHALCIGSICRGDRIEWIRWTTTSLGRSAASPARRLCVDFPAEPSLSPIGRYLGPCVTRIARHVIDLAVARDIALDRATGRRFFSPSLTPRKHQHQRCGTHTVNGQHKQAPPNRVIRGNDAFSRVHDHQSRNARLRPLKEPGNRQQSPDFS